MRCHQVLTGAVNHGSCCFTTASVGEEDFIVYASGCRVVVLDRLLQKVQSIHTADVSQFTSLVDCVTASHVTGLIAASWSGKVFILGPYETTVLLQRSGLKWEHHATLEPKDIVLCLCFSHGGDQLLIGGHDGISLWSQLPADVKDEGCVSFTISDQGTSLDAETANCWKEIWKTSVPSPVHYLRFSPDSLLFASLGQDDKLLKVWFVKTLGPAGDQDDSVVLYDFVYLAHPMPVTSLSWREKSHLLPGGVLPNVLLTSCADNICRIWAQTPNLDPQHTHQSIDVDSSYAISADFRFHIAAVIDPDNDIPLLPDVSRGQDVPLVIHWLNNKTWMYNAVIEKELSKHFDDQLASNASVSRSSFDSLNSNDLEIAQVEMDRAEDWLTSNNISSTASSSVKTLPVPKQRKLSASPASPGREAAIQALKQTGDRRISGYSAPEGERAPLKWSIGTVLRDWQKSADMVFAVYPTDGSLLLWQLDHLDDIIPSVRLVHVSFSSRLPFSFPLEDAYSMSPELILVPHVEAVSVSHPAASLSPVKSSSTAELGHHSSNLSLARSSAFASLQQLCFRSSSEEFHGLSPYPLLSLFSRHLDGSINLWHVELGDDPLRVTCVVHRRRSAGHRFSTTKLVVHPMLPIVLTAAHMEDLTSTFRSTSGSEEVEMVDSSLSMSSERSELILWETSGIGPLAQHSGLDQLATVSSPRLSAFTSMTWMPAIVLSRQKPSSRLCGSLFLANEGGSALLYFHLALVDAANLLYHSHLTKKNDIRHHRDISLSSTDSDLDLDEDEKPSVVSLADIATVISTQSGHRPGCVIKLGLLDQTNSHFFRFSSILFVHAFASGSLPLNLHSALRNQAQMESFPFSDSINQRQEFYVVAISSALKCSQTHLGDRLIQFHMWYVQVDPYTRDEAYKTGQTHPVGGSVETNADSHFPIPTVKSVYLGAQVLDLPIGVTVKHVTSTVDKKQGFFYELISKPAPYCLSISLSDGCIQCWTCKLRCSSTENDNDRLFEWKRWPEKLASIQSNSSFNMGNAISCELIDITSPCCTLLACGHLLTKATCTDSIVSIWQCRSTGGRSWTLADSITVNSEGRDTTGKAKNSQLALDWVSVEDGSFVLAVATLQGITLLAKCFQVKQSKTGKSMEAVGHSESWNQVRYIELDSKNIHGPSIGLAWTSSGSLVLSSQSELQLLSQWHEDSKLSSSPGQVSKASPKGRRLKSISSALYDGSMFEQAAAMTPMLVQYHPDQLLQLLNAGKLQRVRAILGNLIACLRKRITEVGKRARTLSDAEMPRPRVGSLGRVASITGHPTEKDQAFEHVEAISPLSLTELLNSDHTTSQGHPMSKTVANTHSKEDIFEPRGDQYAGLFSDYTLSTESFSDISDTEQEEEEAIPTITAGHFLPEHSKWLAKQLSQFHLPGLSNVDQIRLLAVAETVASTQGSFKSGTIWPSSTSLLSSASGAGYAQASGNDTSSVDDCGLRCLLSLHFYTCLLKCLPPAMRNRAAVQGLATSDFAWAFHSESEEELLSMVPALQRSVLSWADLRAVGIGWWVRSDDRLRRCIEKVAKAHFQRAQQPLDAALFYLAMKKKTLLAGLFRTVRDTRLTQFFSHDFTENRWRRAALKNAFALMSKQRFEQAAAFFLLAGSLLDAVAVCVHQLNDIQLALVISRMYEGDTERGPMVQHILNRYLLGRPSSQLPTAEPIAPSKDVFLKSIALWMLKEYPAALDTLVEGHKQPGQDTVSASQSPAVYNFYLYLRNHPFLLRRGASDDVSDISSGLLGAPATGTVQFKKPNSSQTNRTARITGVGDEPLTLMEKHLLFSAAYAHLNAGCPMLALDVLSHLPNVAVEDDDDIEVESSAREGEQEKTDAEELGGTNGLEWSESASVVVSEERSEAFDWSQPVSVASPQKNTPFDWSLPLARQEIDENSRDGLDISQQVSSILHQSGDEYSHDTSAALIDQNRTDKHSIDDKTPTCSPVALAVAAQMKFHGCIAMLIDQFRSLPAQARHQVGLPSIRQPVRMGIMSEAKSGHALRILFSSALMSELASLHNYCKLTFGDEMDSGIDDSENSQSLVHVLHLLIHYFSLHGAAGSGLLPLQMESIILLQDIIAKKSQGRLLLRRQSEMPPLCLSALNLLPSHISPFHLIQTITDDLIQHVITCKELPTSGNPLQKLSVVKNLATTLSVCVLQCTSAAHTWQQQKGRKHHRDHPAGNFQVSGDHGIRRLSHRSYLREQLEKVDDDLHAMPQLKSPDTPVRGRRGRSAHVSEADLTASQLPVRPTSTPASWPGVKEWPTSLESTERAPSISFSVLLGEATIAIYLALLAAAASEHKAEDILLLLINSPSALMWGRTFGGGAATSHSIGNLNISESVTERSGSFGGSPSSKRRMASHSKGKGEGDLKEVFVSPQITLMEHFVTPSRKQLSKGNLTIDLSLWDRTENEDSDREDEMDGKVDSLKAQYHQDPNSFAWCLVRLAVVRTVVRYIKNFVPVCGIDIADLAGTSPLLHSALRAIESWNAKCISKLQEFDGPPDDFINTDPSLMSAERPPLLKHKSLLEPSNSPFRSCSQAATSASQLWQFLVRQDHLRDIFVYYVFPPEKSAIDLLVKGRQTPTQAKVIHQEMDTVNCFCLNRTNQNCLVLATPKEITEVDVSMMLASDPLAWLEESSHHSNHSSSRIGKGHTVNSLDDDFILVHTSPGRRISSSPGDDFQTGTMASSLLRRNLQGTRRIESHPTLPYYLTGASSGIACMWECSHPRALAIHQSLGSKVTRVHFNHFGSKYGVAADGKLHLFQFGMNTASSSNAYQILECYKRSLNDFVFVSSSSFIASAGLSSDGRNVGLWDTLVRPERALVKGFLCHDGGASVIGYAPGTQLLLSGGRKGDLCLFDVRQRCLMQSFNAHSDSVECLVLHDSEHFFVTGAANGDVKVFHLDNFREHSSFENEHGRGSTSFLRGGALSGVTQLYLTHDRRLFSSGTDGTVKMRVLDV